MTLGLVYEQPGSPSHPKVKFLLDENLPPRFQLAVKRLEPAIDILRVGDPGTVMPGTLDPDLILYAELSGRLLVTNDRKTMRGHLEEHWAKGRRIWGLFWVRPNASIGQLAETLVLVWAASAPDEWLNRVDWIP